MEPLNHSQFSLPKHDCAWGFAINPLPPHTHHHHSPAPSPKAHKPQSQRNIHLQHSHWIIMGETVWKLMQQSCQIAMKVRPIFTCRAERRGGQEKWRTKRFSSGQVWLASHARTVQAKQAHWAALSLASLSIPQLKDLKCVIIAVKLMQLFVLNNCYSPPLAYI